MVRFHSLSGLRLCTYGGLINPNKASILHGEVAVNLSVSYAEFPGSNPGCASREVRIMVLQQTVNLPSSDIGGSNPSLPTKLHVGSIS